MGALALTALAFALAHAGGLQGPLGDAIRSNISSDREATALFYTEVDGWDDWRTGVGNLFRTGPDANLPAGHGE